MGRYRVRRSADSDRDLALIAAHLVESYVSFGEDAEAAEDRAASRILAIERVMLSLGDHPHRGTLRPEVAAGVRSLTRDRATLWFEADETAAEVRILGLFFGGQDDMRRMLARMGGRE